jgi:hypothetical protein
MGPAVEMTVSLLVSPSQFSVRISTHRLVLGQDLAETVALIALWWWWQVANRKYFYKSGRLMKNGIISLQRSRWHQGGGALLCQYIGLCC